MAVEIKEHHLLQAAKELGHIMTTDTLIASVREGLNNIDEEARRKRSNKALISLYVAETMGVIKRFEEHRALELTDD